MDTLQSLPTSFPELYAVSDSIKVVEVANKYNPPDGTPITRIPEYTIPGEGGAYHCSKVETAWTQGFFPGLLWLMLERRRLLPASVDSSYSEDDIAHLARRYQESFRHKANPAINHDQGFRFQLSFGRDMDLTKSDESAVLIDAADSLVDRYSDKIGCIRSWDKMVRVGEPDVWRLDNQDEHYLVIIDNMMNLDLMYLATELTGDPKYAAIATRQAEMMQAAHVRPDGTTYHVVDFTDGSAHKGYTCQGYEDESCWSRGQAWGIYGFAQCALRTGRKDFLDTSRLLTDKFLDLLPESGVPWWDFDAPKPCPYDSSAATIAAAGMLILFRLLRSADPTAAEQYLARAFKLVRDTLRECKTAAASLTDGKVNWGTGEWETILQHSTINGNRFSARTMMDHGLVYADYYLAEFANEALKLRPRPN
ncbi:hypothetical protein CcaverHIS002_0402790 [Cutaneotrichosporon cavernicola]|uniref:Six-hairpin glycosidase n=1 Tax=Cutaneotrichosporon cavernicola TaxID=279322 RepID=A0AA48QVL2_9TREE|nr:uncharacterized protein CcaverHIS019_0402750 [Cutaneotrichosporon cavernicola]BEI83675.1 hypothetical protein CcaverHIS002_0402790 [Cutaneotrichosporon cavernicola]BEI91455.1 hypothetical protein CcaverHIS019_0402750 [Cutaneotrichosporon cavernicola]